MPPPGPDAPQPATVPRPGHAAEPRLDRGMDEDAIDTRRPRGLAQQRRMAGLPVSVDRAPVRRDHRPRGAHRAVGAEGPEPDVDVEPGLMRAMPRRHRPAPRLRDVADGQARPARRPRPRREPLDKGDRGGVAPVAVAPRPRQPPARTARRQGLGPGETARRMRAVRRRRVAGRPGGRGEQRRCRRRRRHRTGREQPRPEHCRQLSRHHGRLPCRMSPDLPAPARPGNRAADCRQID